MRVRARFRCANGLPLDLVVGELFAGHDDGEEDEQTHRVLVIESIGEIIVASNTEVADRRQTMKCIEKIHLGRSNEVPSRPMIGYNSSCRVGDDDDDEEMTFLFFSSLFSFFLST